MNIAIVGIGGIGGYIGAYLAQYYAKSLEHTITFVQRGIHGETIKKQGLTFVSKQTIVVHPHIVCSAPSVTDAYDVIFFCVKSKDLESTAQFFIPNMHPQTVCISLLNGVNNAQRLQSVLPNQRVLDGCIYVSAAITAPGIVSQKGGSGAIYFGPVQNPIESIDKSIQKILLQASIKSELTEDIVTEIWRKYLFICPFATMTSRYNLPIGVLIRKPELCTQTQELMQEIVTLAHAHNAHLNQQHIDAAIELAYKIPETTPTSMQLDVYSGKVPELEVFTQFVVHKAAQMGIQTPAHSVVLPQLQDIIAKQVQHG